MNTDPSFAASFTKYIRFASVAFMVLLPHLGSAIAQPSNQAPPRPSIDTGSETAPVASIHEPTTLAVLKIDLASVDIPQFALWFEKLSGDKPMPSALVMLVDEFFKSLRSTGATELSITMSTVDLMQATPAVVTRTDNPAMLNGLLAMVWQQVFPNQPATLKTVDGITVFGSVETVARITSQANRGNERCGMLQTHRLLDHQLMISLPDESRRDLETLWPDRMPAASPVQFSPRQMVSDVTSVQIGFRLPPSPVIEISLITVDEAAANRVETTLEAAIESAAPLFDQVVLENLSSSIRMSIETEDFEALVKHGIEVFIDWYGMTNGL